MTSRAENWKKEAFEHIVVDTQSLWGGQCQWAWSGRRDVCLTWRRGLGQVWSCHLVLTAPEGTWGSPRGEALGWTSRMRLMSSCWEVCTCCHEPPILLLMLALWGWIFKENEENWFTSGEMFPYRLVPQGRQGTTRMLGEEGSGSVVQRLQRPGTHESWVKDRQADAAGGCCQHSLVPQPPCPSAGPVGGWVAGHPENRPRWQPLTNWGASKHPGCLAKQLPV